MSKAEQKWSVGERIEEIALRGEDSSLNYNRVSTSRD